MKEQRRKGPTEGQVDLDEILPEYDFSRAQPNKYASLYAVPSKTAERGVELGSVPLDLEAILAHGFSDDSARQRFMAENKIRPFVP